MSRAAVAPVTTDATETLKIASGMFIPASAPIEWPRLDALALGSEQHAWRAAGIGGSDANTILSGDTSRLMRLWHEKRGLAPSEDLTGILPVMLGCWTECFNRQWYEQSAGHVVTESGSRFVSHQHNWRRCTVDGLVPALGAVWEAKHTSAFAKNEDVIARYMPQLQHNMAVVGADRAVLSVIFGNHRWETFEISADWLYQGELLIAEARFWDAVRKGEPPVAAPVPPAPKPIGTREICLEGNNMWASAAAEWLESREAARRHLEAVSNLKELVEPDVRRAHGHGIEAKRSRNGAITIKEMVQ